MAAKSNLRQRISNLYSRVSESREFESSLEEGSSFSEGIGEEFSSSVLSRGASNAGETKSRHVLETVDKDSISYNDDFEDDVDINAFESVDRQSSASKQSENIKYDPDANIAESRPLNESARIASTSFFPLPAFETVETLSKVVLPLAEDIVLHDQTFINQQSNESLFQDVSAVPGKLETVINETVAQPFDSLLKNAMPNPDFQKLIESIHEASTVLPQANSSELYNYYKLLEKLFKELQTRSRNAEALILDAMEYWRNNLVTSQANLVSEMTKKHKEEMAAFHEHWAHLTIHLKQKDQRKNSPSKIKLPYVYQDRAQKIELAWEDQIKRRDKLLQLIRNKHQEQAKRLELCLSKPLDVLSSVCERSIIELRKTTLMARKGLGHCQDVYRRFKQSPYEPSHRAQLNKSFESEFQAIRHAIVSVAHTCRSARHAFSSVRSSGPIEEALFSSSALNFETARISSEVAVYPAILVKKRPKSSRENIVRGLSAMQKTLESSKPRPSTAPRLNAPSAFQYETPSDQRQVYEKPPPIMRNERGKSCPSCSRPVCREGIVVPSVFKYQELKGASPEKMAYCSWTCARRWVENNGQKNLKYEQLLLIDLYAGGIVQSTQ